MFKGFSKILLVTFVLLSTAGLAGGAGRLAARGVYLEASGRLWQGGSETEPNDTPAQANPIAINQSIVGQIPVTNRDDIDYFVLTTEAGRAYQVTLTESPPNANYRFELALYNANQDQVASDDTQGGTATLSWTASDITYYLSVVALDLGTEDAMYELRVIRFPSTPQPPAWDDCEINDSLTGTWSDNTPPGGPCPVSVGATVEDLNFVPYTGQPAPNPDFFLVSVKAGRTYQVEARVEPGVDSAMYLYPPGATDLMQFIDFNDDASGLGYGSRIRWTPPSDAAYVIRVENLEPLPHTANETYTLVIADVTPTPTPTATQATVTPGTATATRPPVVIPGAPDAFEPNFSFDRATLIGLGRKYTNLNFVPWTGANADNDFFKLWVIPGKLYTCQTTELGTATNTNMILYSCPDFSCGFAGNDNVEPFDPNDPYRSRIIFYSPYEGYLYLLLGQVGADRILPEEWMNLTYSLECFIDQPGTATPTPTGAFTPPPPATFTPPPADTPGAPAATPTPVQVIVVPMTTPELPSAPTPAATPTPQLYVIDVLLYYDANKSSQPDTGEGVRDVLARVYDAISGDLLSVDYTDESGRVRFTVPGRGPVRVSIPFFGFDQIVTQSNTNIEIRIAPSP